MSDLRNKNFAGKDLTLSGIGGWLSFIGLNLAVNILLTLVALITNYLPIVTEGTFMGLLNTDIGLFSIVLFEIIFYFLFLIFSILLILPFIKKLRCFPRLMIIYLTTNLLFIYIETIISANLNGENISSDFVRATVLTVVWVCYLRKSIRVKNTFIN